MRDDFLYLICFFFFNIFKLVKEQRISFVVGVVAFLADRRRVFLYFIKMIILPMTNSYCDYVLIMFLLVFMIYIL